MLGLLLLYLRLTSEEGGVYMGRWGCYRSRSLHLLRLGHCLLYMMLLGNRCHRRRSSHI